MDKLVSIIVPVYNVEKYINRCINSLVSQTYSNIEILLIDDGSTDTSGLICDSYAKKYKQIKVFHKKNEGLGFTRNFGIKKCRGKYICFVDSDDYINRNTIQISLETSIKNNSDIVFYGLNRITKDNNIIEYVPCPQKNIYAGDEIINDFLPDYICDNPKSRIKRNYTNSSCTCLFKTELFKKNNILYPSERKIISEDTYMMLDLLNYTKSLSIINKCFYNYCENLDSLSHSYKKNRYKSLKIFYYESIKLFKKFNYNNESIYRFNLLFLNYVFADFKSIIYNKKISAREKYLEFKEIIKDDLYRKIINEIDINNESLKRKIFYCFVKLKQIFFCMIIIKLKYS